MEETKVITDPKKAASTKEMVSPVESDQKIASYESELNNLRKDGSLKIYQLKEEIYDIKRKQMIDEITRQKIIESDKEGIKAAKEIKKTNAPEVKNLVKESVSYTKDLSKTYEKEMKDKGTALVEAALPGHKEKLASIEETYKANLAELKEKNEAKINAFQANKPAPSEDSEKSKSELRQYKKDLENLKKECASDVSSLKVSYRSSLADENNAFDKIKKTRKDMIYGSYLSRYNKVNDIRAGHNTIAESVEYKAKSYAFNFNWSNFLLNNALYIIVILFFVTCFIISPIAGSGNILTASNIFGFLETASSRVFFALGVAGLIVLGGTDLSIGRMIGLGTLCVGFLLHDGDVPARLFGVVINFDSMNFGLRVFLALALSICATTLFSFIAGFFSAKFKMHPFITTLSTMMIMYGIMYVATDGVPTGNPDANGINQTILGRLPGGFPKYVIYAVIAIAVVWFIWNKTKFGKNMFAVGGNAEAASVSGISYFKVTLGVFIMAGVLYGFGTFFYGFYSNPAANTGYGFELDAIASCVVGGISFFGGIGKVKGAVIGCLIFAGLSYVLTIMNVSSYWQFVIKGIILMSAVALDSLKYLKKK